MRRNCTDLDVGDTIIINDVRVTLERKSGRRARLAVDFGARDRVEVVLKSRSVDEKIDPSSIERLK